MCVCVSVYGDTIAATINHYYAHRPAEAFTNLIFLALNERVRARDERKLVSGLFDGVSDRIQLLILSHE